jgi:hypothetical protein
MGRLVGFLPRLAALTVVWLLLTAALTFAAGQKLTASAPAQAPVAATAPAISTVVVPDVRRQAYVFAKGILEDSGFAWKVQGDVQGFASNRVAGQAPAPGTRVLDTGSPTIVLQLSKGSYPQTGMPENAAPFPGTALRLADVASAPVARPKVAAKPKVAVRTKPVARPKAAAPATAKPEAPATRKPDFTFPGSRPEPQDELPLPTRAQNLRRWLATNPKPTDANVGRWLYQHAWVADGARQGWWHGADALRILIEADRRANAVWGIGGKSEAVARAALAEVEARRR